jgi:hypothetical protein
MLERDSVYVSVPMIVVSIADFPPTADEWPFHVDHVPARVHGGDDCSKYLLEWGTHVAKNNSRPPRRV